MGMLQFFLKFLTMFLVLPIACGQLSNSSGALDLSSENLFDAFDLSYLQVGDTKVKVYTLEEPRHGNSKIYTYLNVHYNEATSVTAAKRVVQSHGGRIIVLTNPADRRNLIFSSEHANFEVDPNRIFTDEGIHASLVKWNNRAPRHAIAALREYRDRFLEFAGVHRNSTDTVVALHNNTNGAFSLASYLPGGPEEASARRIHRSRDPDSISRDLDDFFYLTDAAQFETISGRDNSSVLQDGDTAADDGSLSIWSGQNNVRYVNVEAENGHEEIQYRQLLELQFLDGF